MNTARKIEFVGSEYGGFPCCLDSLDKNSIVLDVGVGEDISFALSLHEKVGCKIELFDFTPDSISWFKDHHSDKGFLTYNEYGLSDFDGLHEVYDYGEGISRRASWMGFECNEKHPVKAIDTILEEKNISRIDLLKLDVEGEEYKILPYMFKRGIFPEQICVEEHSRFLDGNLMHQCVFSQAFEYYIPAATHQNEICLILEK